MKNYLVVLLVLVAVISLSCGIKNAFYESDENKASNGQLNQLTGALSNNSDYFEQEPLPDNQPEADVAPSNGDDNGEAPNEYAAKPGMPVPPSNPPLTGDYDILDANNVQIIRKNGELKTIFPSGEVYIVPDTL